MRAPPLPAPGARRRGTRAGGAQLPPQQRDGGQRLRSGLGGGAYAHVEGNVFAFNNHSVAADGQAYSGYVARFNYVLRGALTVGKQDTYPHSFDVHGRFKAEEHEYAGGPAGTYFDVSFNTVLGEQDYGFLGRLTRAAFALRGRPAQGAQFTGNVLAHDDFDEGVKLRRGDDDRLDEDRPSTFNLRSGGNRYDTDYSTELATGDFDGDRRADVFVANGTGWFFSRGGIRPWEYLRPSNKRVGELGFADIDNDGVTDVLYRDPAGELGYVKSGSAALAPLTSVPVALKDVRFGDFDGDRLTDMFYTRRTQWQIWYGRTRRWTPAQTSTSRSPGCCSASSTPCAAPMSWGSTRSGWSLSSAATGRWAKLNGRLTSSFSQAVAADFDGNGRTDIAIGDGREVALQPRWPLGPDDVAKRQQGAHLPRAEQAAGRSFRRRHAGQGHQLQPQSLRHPRQRALPAGRVARDLARPRQRRRLQCALCRRPCGERRDAKRAFALLIPPRSANKMTSTAHARKLRLLIALLALGALGAPASASAIDAPIATEQWRVANADTVQTSTDYELHNGKGGQMGYDERRFGVSLGFVGHGGGHFQFKPKGASPRVRDHRVRTVLEDEPLALYNTKTKQYLGVGFPVFGISLKWSKVPLYDWRLRDIKGPRFALYGNGDYLVHGHRTVGSTSSGTGTHCPSPSRSPLDRRNTAWRSNASRSSKATSRTSASSAARWTRARSPRSRTPATT